ncbi:MAG: ABC transporter ATP-binding protein [Parafannyhessea sp.]|uniref:ABC transporter ATP-binding protein n=1 Tax=Parafannyhessea sp. TaxID=2847324 RepID=UPI003F100246
MLEVSGMAAGYGGAFALDVPVLGFPDGCVSAIVGRNGCGKSTLLKTLAALLPYRGSVRVEGRELRDLSHTERARHVAYLPQQLPVAAMDVVTLVRHGRFARMGASKVLGAQDHAAVREAMEATGTWELATKRLAQVSGGELQRAYIAMVMAQGARTLLLDEPASHLDPARQVELMALLDRLAKGGRCVVLASHDLPSAFSAAGRVVVMEGGTVACCGPPADVAARTGELRRALGVTVRREQAEGLLWPYVLAR